MPHGYRQKQNGSTKVVYEKQHKNGERTRLIADKVNLPDEGERWTPSIEDEGKTASLGKFTSKSEAMKRMKQWMRNNPKGLQKPAGTQFGGGSIPGQDSGVPGMDGNGLF